MQNAPQGASLFLFFLLLHMKIFLYHIQDRDTMLGALQECLPVHVLEGICMYCRLLVILVLSKAHTRFAQSTQRMDKIQWPWVYKPSPATGEGDVQWEGNLRDKSHLAGRISLNF